MHIHDNQHFSHQHPLEPLGHVPKGEDVKCNGCELNIINQPYHGCTPCKFYLHEKCLNLPRSLNHPFHPSHPLTLLPSPTYWSQSFYCDACKGEGFSFSFSCATCQCDLHTYCATFPTKLRIDDHPHELELVTDWSDHFKKKLMNCDLCCGVLHESFWIYYCFECEFGCHLSHVAKKMG